MAAEDTVARTALEIVIYDKPRVARRFFQSCGLARDSARDLALVILDLAHAPETRCFCYAFIDHLLCMNARVIQLFCVMSRHLAIALFERAIARGIMLDLANKLSTCCIEIEDPIKCVHGATIARGKYEAPVFAAIMLGICRAPAQVVANLRALFEDHTLVDHAVRALDDQEDVPADLLEEYLALRCVRPIAIARATILDAIAAPYADTIKSRDPISILRSWYCVNEA